MRRLGTYSLFITLVSGVLIALLGFNPAGLLADGPEQLSPWRNMFGLLVTVAAGVCLLGIAMALVGTILRYIGRRSESGHLVSKS